MVFGQSGVNGLGVVYHVEVETNIKTEHVSSLFRNIQENIVMGMTRMSKAVVIYHAQVNMCACIACIASHLHILSNSYCFNDSIS